MSDIERLYEKYRLADRKDKPGLGMALDVIAGTGYVEKRESLAETVKASLIRNDGLDTTADLADQIAADVLKKQWRL